MVLKTITLLLLLLTSDCTTVIYCCCCCCCNHVHMYARYMHRTITYALSGTTTPPTPTPVRNTLTTADCYCGRSSYDTARVTCESPFVGCRHACWLSDYYCYRHSTVVVLSTVHYYCLSLSPSYDSLLIIVEGGYQTMHTPAPEMHQRAQAKAHAHAYAEEKKHAGVRLGHRSCIHCDGIAHLIIATVLERVRRVIHVGVVPRCRLVELRGFHFLTKSCDLKDRSRR